MNLKNLESKFADALANLPEYQFHVINYSGVINAKDVFISSSASPNVHPLSAALSTDPSKYFQYIDGLGASIIAEYVDRKGVKHSYVVNADSSANIVFTGAMTAGSSVAVLKQIAATNQTWYDIKGDETVKPEFNYPDLIQQPDNGYGVVYDPTVKDALKYGKINNARSAMRAYSKVHSDNGGLIDFNNIDEAARALIESYAVVAGGVWADNVIWYKKETVFKSHSGPFGLPVVKGLRRVLVCEGSGLLNFYILGGGTDIVLSRGHTIGQDYYTGIRTTIENTFTRLELSEPDKFSAATIGMRGLTLRKMFPLSALMFFVQNIVVSQSTTVNIDPSGSGLDASEVTETNGATNYVTGMILTDDYEEYLSTGLGVFEPRKPGDVEKVISTWRRLAGDGVMFRLQPETLHEKSVKDLHVYKEYGKARAKACKTNDFMDKQFNDEYTWKQVDNYMTAQSTWESWICDIYDAAAAPAVGTIPTVTLKGYNSSNVEVTTSSEALVLRLVLPSGKIVEVRNTVSDVDGVGALADLITEDIVLSDPNNFLAVFGSTGDELSQLSSGVRDIKLAQSAFNVRNVGYYNYVAPSYSILHSQDPQHALNYLVSQVTDYREFKLKLRKLLVDLSASAMYK